MMFSLATSSIAKTTARRLVVSTNPAANCKNAVFFGQNTLLSRQLQTGRVVSRRYRPGKGRKRSKPGSSNTTKQSSKHHSPQQHRHKATIAGTIKPKTAGQQGAFQATKNNHRNLWERINLWLNEPRQLPIPRWISPQMVTFRFSECFGHASFFLVAVSYAVDDFLHLRLIAIAGSSAMLVFTYFHPHGRILWLPFQWNCMFIALNSWRVAKVYWDYYRSGQLTPSVDALYENHLSDAMEKTDFARLVRLGTLETYRKGEAILAQGCENRCVRLVVEGDLVVDRDGQTTYWLREGQFLSEMGLHAGLGLRGTVTSCCSVRAASDSVTLVSWDRTELMHLLDLHKSIDRSLKAVMSWDIVSKLKSQRVLLASGVIDDPEMWTVKRREQSLDRYRAILQNMLAHPRYLNERKDKLAKYREIHQVNDLDHIVALQSIGWTEAEFEQGTKEGQLDEDKLERQTLGMGWWFQSWWKAI